MQSVTITKLENAGKFLCRPKCSEDDALLYLDFLASLNTYFEKKKKDVIPFAPDVGNYCAVHIAVGESPHELWYRAKIMCMFQSTGGFIAKLLLVDEGEMVCTPKARMRRLPEKFVNYPHQVMSCVLHDLVPVTIGAAIDLNMSLKKSHHWDSAATRYVEKLIKDADTSVETISVDEDNVYHVVLYIFGDSTINVNELLVREKYATVKTMDDLTLSRQSILVEKYSQKERNNMFNLIHPDIPRKDNADNKGISTARTLQILKGNVMEREKQRHQDRLKQYANKERDELLKLLHDFDEIPSSTKAHISESSGTSELSDMENTPVPPMSCYKRVKPGLGAAEVIADKLGQEASDLLTRGFGIQKESKPSKHVSFATHKEVLGSGTPFSVANSKISPEKFDFSTSNNHSTLDKDIVVSRNVDSSYILQALSVGDKSRNSSIPKFSDDDVLVYGKLKRDPFTSVNQLNLPLPLKSCLTDMNCINPTAFQKHLWSAMAAFRNVVGIDEAGTRNATRVLGYLLPILCNMVDQEGSYKSLGKGNGPFLVVCVGGWREAQDVYDICESLTKYYRKNIHIDVRYGGMDNEDERNIRLINGCDLLITTMPSLNKAVGSNYINLNRLCHVVFDNADILVEKFTEDIKIFMRTYVQALRKSGNAINSQIIAVGMKWSYGIHSLMKSYLTDPLVIIANKIEAALFVKVPLVPEICKSSERLEHLIGFLETDAVDENTIIFTNTATSAEHLHNYLKDYSIMTNVITDFTTALDARDIKLAWKSASLKSKNNILILNDHAVNKANIKNASCIIHYDYPQKKSQFGNRLSCLFNTIRENENIENPKSLLCQIFITEQNNGFKYCTGLVKLLRRSGQNIPDLLKSMAISSRELKEEQKQYSEICPRLKLFGECSYIEDCNERHTIFKDRDLIGLCPSTGFIKVIILDVISASSFWGRIVEHRLPYDPDGSAYDTTVYLKLCMNMQLYYSNSDARVLCCNAERYDICVINTIEYGYQRVRIEKVLTKVQGRPKTLEVFGIDNGFTSIADFNKLIVCAEEFRIIPPQAAEIIACCVKPVEKGNSWTDEASREMERIKGRTLEGRVQFSLQNTIWVDPLVEKKMLQGLQTKTYALDVARDLLNLGYAEKNLQHVEKLRKLLFDVQGHPIEITGNKQNLPLSMIEHESAYLADDDYEDVYVTAVVDPGLFFVQRAENSSMIKHLDNKIDATMSVAKTDEIDSNTFPVGYICVAQFSGDQKWYRGQILGISKNQINYDIFFVDHGDREWVGKSKVAKGWQDILTEPFQAIECSFKNISPIESEWTLEDGDVFWDLIENKLLSAKVVSISASSYINDTLSYAIELFDTTNNQTQNISHELVYMGVAQGALQCLQEMFPHASISGDKVIKDDFDKCPDLCVEIHQAQDLDVKIEKAEQLKSIILSAPLDSNTLIENGSIESVCKLLALSKKPILQEILILSILEMVAKDERYAAAIEDNDGIKALCEILRKTTSEAIKTYVIQTIRLAAKDMWSLHVLQHMSFIDDLCQILQSSESPELLISVLDALVHFCKGNESNCTAVRHGKGLEALCDLFNKSNDIKVIERCTYTLQVVLSNQRNKEKIREIGGLQILASLYQRKMNEPSFKNILQTLLTCIDEHEINREYLHKIDAHQNLLKCAKSPKKYSMMTRLLLNELVHKLTPAPVTDFLVLSENDIDPRFEDQKDEFGDNYIAEQIAPKTMWSQRRNTVTVSICLRGVQSEETDIGPNTIKFRTVLNHVEYVLYIELYANVAKEDGFVSVKGGEVLITLWKEKRGEIWPRLLASTQKLPYISIDFDRWVDEFPEIETEPSDGSIRFQPDLPKPPPCKSYEGEEFSVYIPGTTSSDESMSTDDEDYIENIGAHPDYFNI